MKITFYGAVEEVTGSRYFIEHEDKRILVDCGLFQGEENLAKHNWDPFPVEPKTIDAIILTHAHIDHTGYIPALVKNGFTGKIYCSQATFALCSILLVDSGHIMEQEANNVRTDMAHPKPALFTIQDAEHSLSHFQVTDYDKPFALGSLTITLIRSGHILGSSFVVISDGKQTLTFSGDLGRPDDFIMLPPPHLKSTDYLVLESTYGDRLHEESDPIQALGDVVNKTMARGGVLIIPAFAVGRTQTILYCLYQLKQKKLIPDVPIFLDSPMGIRVTNLYYEFLGEHKLSAHDCAAIFNVAAYTPGSEESKQIDRIKSPAIIIAGSGMANGGRVLHHIKHFISNPKNTLLFVGYQAEGTPGNALVGGAQEISIDGAAFKVHASIKTIRSLSAHADAHEILEWLSSFEHSPKKVFITHGQLESAQALKKKIEERFGWLVVIPTYAQSFDLK